MFIFSNNYSKVLTFLKFIINKRNEKYIQSKLNSQLISKINKLKD